MNIARALANQGARVAVISAVGDDIGADLITAALAKAGIEDRLIRTTSATGAYLAIEGDDGDLHAGVSDLTALETLAPETIAAAISEACS